MKGLEGFLIAVTNVCRLRYIGAPMSKSPSPVNGLGYARTVRESCAVSSLIKPSAAAENVASFIGRSASKPASKLCEHLHPRFPTALSLQERPKPHSRRREQSSPRDVCFFVPPRSRLQCRLTSPGNSVIMDNPTEGPRYTPEFGKR
jgi:hypothetical protein